MSAPEPAYLDADHLPETLARLDALIENAEDEEKTRVGLGMRLALSMAQEIRSGKPLGSETTGLVAGWMERFGGDTVDQAVGVAREFLTRPDQLAKEFASRLGLTPQTDIRPSDLPEE
jgi:hypothetical protein